MGSRSFTTGAPAQLGMAPGTLTSTHWPSSSEKYWSSHSNSDRKCYFLRKYWIFLTGARTALATVAPGVVLHPALTVHPGGAPGLAGVAVPGDTAAVGLPSVEEGEDAGLATGPHCPAGPCQHSLMALSDRRGEGRYSRQVFKHWRPSAHFPEISEAPPQVWSSALAHLRQQPHSS